MILEHFRPSPAEKALMHSKLAGASVPRPAVCLQREFEPNLDQRLTPGAVPGLGAGRLVHTRSPGVQSVSGHSPSGCCRRCPGVGLSLPPPPSRASRSEQRSSPHPPIPHCLPPSPPPIRSQICCLLLGGDKYASGSLEVEGRTESRTQSGGSVLPGHVMTVSRKASQRTECVEVPQEEQARRLPNRRDISGGGNLLGKDKDAGNAWCPGATLRQWGRRG